MEAMKFLFVAIVVAIAGPSWGSPKILGSVEKAPFGTTADGIPAEIYTLINARGMKVKLTTYGATITSISVPDGHGKFQDVILGFDDLPDYESKSPDFGATIGRFANRIGKAEFHLDGHDYHLSANEGQNSLHGGHRGYDKRIWGSVSRMTPEGPMVHFKLHDPDGEQGYPGDVDASVIYTLTNSNTLRIQYSAVTDKPTPINLTNHAYFNLRDGGSSSVLSYLCEIPAAKYTPVDSKLIPTGKIVPVKGTPYDFRTRKQLGKNLDRTPGNPKGYDINFDLGVSSKLRKVAEVMDPQSGRKLEVFSTQPGLQLYTSNSLDGTLTGKQGIKYQRYAGFCLEAQHFPDSPNHPNFPNTILRPKDTYRETIEYRFSSVSKGK